MFYRENDVFQEATERVRMLFDTHDDIIVNMSGGKDSTVVFNIAMNVAKEKGRLPLKVFWLDQEAEWQHTVDYVDSIMRREDVKPFWFQIPFDFTNSLSQKSNFVRVWDETQKDKWVHPQSDISIKENPTNKERFHELMEHLHEHITDGEREISDEERQKLYAEFLEQQAKENAQEVQMTSEKALQKARETQQKVAGEQKKYYRCICEKCGHTMYVDANDLVIIQEEE